MVENSFYISSSNNLIELDSLVTHVEEEEFVSLKIQKLIGKKIKKTIEKLVLRSTGATRSIKLGHCSDPEDDVAGKLSICNYIFFNVKWDTRWGEKIKFGVSLCHFFLRATVCQILSLHAARESKKRGAKVLRGPTASDD